ncbi:HAD hydrolase-like protein [Roseateles sp. BYS96W]|uniref:HAD hydrolase-like protein n=1 Tax=Pelomonas nitida TaxID=3299027 RepID=A0ABW7G4Q8_9BURK
MKRAAFLDRDGVINQDRAYVHCWEDSEFVPGAPLAAVYHRSHHPSGRVAALTLDCDCRKPAPGLLLRAAREHGLPLTESMMVGDKPSDIAAARAAGVGRAYLVASNNVEAPTGGADEEAVGADGAFTSLAHCVDHLLAAQV